MMRLRLLTDGRAGNVAQALGLAEAMVRRVPGVIAAETLPPEPLLGRLPQGLRALLPGPDVTGAADLFIGAGRRGNLAAARARAAGLGPAVAILDPQLSFTRFDAVLIPEHDARQGPNLIATCGALNQLTLGAIAAAPQEMLPDRPAPRLALLLGGPSRSARFGAAEMAGLLADLDRFAGWSILATPSRRSPPAAVAALRAARPDAWVWDGAGANPYPGLLARADAVMVTADSVNMVSEAATTGLPVFVSGGAGLSRKLARFHAALGRRGITRPAAEGPARWTYAPLAEADRVAALLLDRLGVSFRAPMPI